MASYVRLSWAAEMCVGLIPRLILAGKACNLLGELLIRLVIYLYSCLGRKLVEGMLVGWFL
jgi:hypothetical protein